VGGRRSSARSTASSTADTDYLEDEVQDFAEWSTVEKVIGWLASMKPINSRFLKTLT